MKLENQKLLTLIKIIKENKLKVRVGIIGESAMRPDRLNNATVGAFHEFGTSKMPMRSFLRMPLATKMDEYIQNVKNIFGTKVINAVYEERSMEPLLKRVGIVAERVVEDAFATEGFGSWAPLSPWTVEHKKNMQILTETGQLRKSITSEVK